jgi:hypothetical protein
MRLHPAPKGVIVFEAHALFLGLGIHHYRRVDANLQIKVVIRVSELVLRPHVWLFDP